MPTKTRPLKNSYWIIAWAVLLPMSALNAAESIVSSPDGNIIASVVFDEAKGTVSYKAKSSGAS